MAKLYLNVAYKDREMAKRLGARWDPSVKRWYCPSGSPLATVFSWKKAGSQKGASESRGQDIDAAASRRDDLCIRPVRSLYQQRERAGISTVDQPILPFPNDRVGGQQLSLLG